MRFWRASVFSPSARTAADNGHPLYVWPEQGFGRIDDPEGSYLSFYAADSPDAAIAERLGNYARWTPAVLQPPPATPAGSALALIEYEGEPEVLNLDDPFALIDWGLQPSSVVSKDRTLTQRWARAVYDSGRYDGISWWSYRDPRWATYGFWSREGLEVVGSPTPLSLDSAELVEAARVINRVIER
ncbi:RES family NAD+ phosphorylase [Saxibacter everestensis]|uniref:RES family NAD+ phosphorylase n=1 Tax=Saxibacter everestensis TaxID=2909229 RepID=A0ABY8QRA3_9MICO|nr:RES family NAD+ phosphorylase [Brevibacteriaceae bacterium ZFBP1038]